MISNQTLYFVCRQCGKPKTNVNTFVPEATAAINCTCADPYPHKCVLCGEKTFITIQLPYGSKFDGDYLCNVCVSKFIDPIIELKQQ